MIRLMPVGGPQDVGQEGVATGRGDFSLSSSDQGACGFCTFYTPFFNFLNIL
ncbi:hypothetical protein [Neobacillus terrae]|uniref:hypothetical protein n=1 Tax=Neobacillus terrae TaxID=3034837 RepID=UPI001407B100|nr:hypothetical protein [Neobacillus terrae]NHM32740.1 hypothetical protein [Neobacillus terrae]